MKKESALMVVIIVLLGNSMLMFKSKISADENTDIYKDSITDYYRPYKIGYIKTNTTLKYLDSLHETGLIINLTGISKSEIKRRITNPN